ncbi:MAG: stage V sporulation protein AB [Lachnospiraceae bacterium]|nr:stage V sporulation protein AB [Lachnospiraceae bacterium]
MFSKHLLLSIVGFTGGVSVAGGAFALIVVLSIVPRMIGKTNTASKTLHYESMIMAGGILGTIYSVYPHLRIPLGSPFLILYGLCSGIQVGCLIMALSEIMNVFPLIFRRIKLKSGMSAAILSLALGKVVGGFWYFFQRMGL